MPKIIVTGSIAYDNLFKYAGRFRDDINPENLTSLSVSFLAGEHKIFYGGCGANIAYTLNLLGFECDLYGVLGNDSDKYLNYFKNLGINTSLIHIENSKPSSAAFILSDSEQNQISFFSIGAMSETQGCMEIQNAKIDDLAIVSPDLPARMLSLSRSAINQNLKLIFDPGQQVNQFEVGELKEILSGALGLVLNEYEYSLLFKKLNVQIPDLISKFDIQFVIITLGSKGCELFTPEENKRIGAYNVDEFVDGTGAGDAFRSGLLYGLANSKSLSECCQYACAVASFVVEKNGTQNHSFTMEDVIKRAGSIS